MQSAQVKTQPLNLVPIATNDGVPIWIPKVTYDALLARGGGKIIAEIAADTSGWLTPKEAAMEHMKDRDGITQNAATISIGRAAKRGEFKSSGEGQNRKIDPVSFRAWRLEQRERNLDEMN